MPSSRQHDQTVIRFGDRAVGDGAPCFVIAEIGANHNRDMDLARRMIDAAVGAGADCVKFQTFKADQHYSRLSPRVSSHPDIDIHTLIEQTEIDRDWLAPLKNHTEAQGAVFLSSIGDTEALALLEGLDVCGYKNTSFELTDLDLIGAMAATGKPLILSTGMADMDDIRRAVEVCRRAGNDQVILLQCTSLYPAPAHLSNLRAMAAMRDAFGLLTGYSDHTEGDQVPLAAVALGACVVEKHFTTDRSLPGPDHFFAMEPDGFRTMVSRLREVEAALGDGVKDGPRREERENFEIGRRSLHAAVDIPAGAVITTDMLCVKRPGLGIPPHRRGELVGRTARADIKADQWITWDAV